MKKKIQTALFTGAVLAALATPTMADDTQVGVGASFNGDTTEIRGSVTLDEHLRLEPYFGLNYQNPDQGSSTTDYTIGTTLEYTKDLHDKINGYVGGFAGIDHIDRGSGSTNFVFGPLAGVEYAFHSHFTLGGEIRLNVGVGDDTTLRTDSTILLRYYF